MDAGVDAGLRPQTDDGAEVPATDRFAAVARGDRRAIRKMNRRVDADPAGVVRYGATSAR
ncbi:hypothetical protein [Haloplanus salilacus]|uniref:hypothetical protein n=1 Tax=Haloplanus salilacus TaxID=2949994 RepID=UPI0030CCAB02